MDINNLMQMLIQAMNNSRTSQLQTIDQSRRLYNAQVNNSANASGLLYSTKPAFQQAQYVSSEYLPKFTDINSKAEQSIINANNQAKEAAEKIKALNDAAAELNRS